MKQIVNVFIVVNQTVMSIFPRSLVPCSGRGPIFNWFYGRRRTADSKSCDPHISGSFVYVPFRGTEIIYQPSGHCRITHNCYRGLPLLFSDVINCLLLLNYSPSDWFPSCMRVRWPSIKGKERKTCSCYIYQSLSLLINCLRLCSAHGNQIALSHHWNV